MSVLKEPKKIWLDICLKYAISRRTLSSAVDESGENPGWSAKQLNYEVRKRIRRRHLDRLVQTTRKIDNVQEAKLKQFDDATTKLGSIVAARRFAQNINKYAGAFPDVISELKERAREELEEAENAKPLPPDYPLQKLTRVEKIQSTNTELQTSSTELSTEFGRKKFVAPDRGFFVYRHDFVDEYTAGSDMSLPQEKQYSLIISSPTRKKKMLTAFRKRYGPTDAVEEIEFQLPTQKIAPRVTDIQDESRYNDDWTIRYGVADAEVPAADKNCPACGGRFHCQNSGLPGFLPVDYFLERQEVNFVDTVCRRCYLLKTHNFLVNVNVSPVNYEEMLSRLRHLHEVLIILIVDMLDFPCSIYKTLPDLIGHGKHVIIVGNKIDLIPPDTVEQYLKHYKMCLIQAIQNLEFDKKMNILQTFLISAKTGYNIEELITFIQTNWQNKGDIYLIGCTNSGKSTLFNAFLQSDLCKVRAMDLVERATTSVWPGTTLNLLKFPVMNPTPYKLMIRQRRLQYLKHYFDEELRYRKHLLETTGQSQYAVLQGNVGQTFVIDKENNDDADKPSGSLLMMPEKSVKAARKSRVDLSHPIFKYGKWCYDTPGTINHDQITNLLTLDELVKTIPGEIIVPRTVILRRRQTLFIAGLARMDFIGPTSQTFLTVFASRHLPLNMVERHEALRFYKKYFGTAALEVPFGGEERLSQFPLLKSEFIELEGIGTEESCADIVLSSIGWVAVTGRKERRLRFHVWTPDRRGIHVRFPAMLPFAVNAKGRRIPETNEYEPQLLNARKQELEIS